LPTDLFRLYLVTDRSHTCGRPLLEVVEAALAGGADAVQLREKDLPARDLLELAVRLVSLCRRYGARVLINDRIDVALAARADGVHLPGNSFTAAEARHLLGPGALIGMSTHSLAQAQEAAAGGADFIVLGPIYDTPSKRPFGLPPLGLEPLAVAARSISVPVLAIGGVSADRVAPLCEHGAYGIATISALLEAQDPRTAAETMRAQLQRYVRS